MFLLQDFLKGLRQHNQRFHKAVVLEIVSPEYFYIERRINALKQVQEAEHANQTTLKYSGETISKPCSLAKVSAPDPDNIT